MSLKNRIKPKLLRDIKTEALLVFIRTTLEQNFYEIENMLGYSFILGNDEDNNLIHIILKELLINLQSTVVSSIYLKNLIENANKNPTASLLAKKEAPLIYYYSILVRTIEMSLKDGTAWVPELIVIALLSEWLIEEKKSTYFYPYLNKIDYVDVLSRYDNCRKNLKEDRKIIIMNMYKVSSKLIEQLKKVEYKVNRSRKRK